MGQGSFFTEQIHRGRAVARTIADADGGGFLSAVDGGGIGPVAEKSEREREEAEELHGLAFRKRVVGEPDGVGFVQLGGATAREEENPFEDTQEKHARDECEEQAGDDGVHDAVEAQGAGVLERA